MAERKNEIHYRMTKAVAAFKRNLFAFVVINLSAWTIWAVNSWKDYSENFRGIPWPVWITLGWGAGIAFHYWRVYQRTNRNDLEWKGSK